MHEASCHEANCFLTLTYRDQALPEDMSIDKRILQRFVKRFRKEYPVRIKYYGSGEYGELKGRPHYHALFFNVGMGDVGWKSSPEWDFSHKCWYGTIDAWDEGHVAVGEVTVDSARYVADYTHKDPQTGVYGLYGGRKPPFKLQSQGLGKEYCFANADRLRANLGDTHYGVEVGLPLAYRRWLDIDTEAWRKRGSDRTDEVWRLYIEKYGHDIVAIKEAMASHVLQHERNIVGRRGLKPKERFEEETVRVLRRNRSRM